MSQAAQEKPSAVAKGAEEGLKAAGQSAESFMRGLTSVLLRADIPEEAKGKGTAVEVAGGLANKAKGVSDMVWGLLGVISSPGVGVGAGVEQALVNAGLDPMLKIPGGIGGAAPLLRAALGGGDIKNVAGMTLGEAANIAAQWATPGALSRAKKGLPAAAREMKGERGSLGPGPTPGSAAGGEPPSRQATTGTAGAGEPPTGRVAVPSGIDPSYAEFGAGPESRVNVGRVNAAESVKRTMEAVNRSQAERLAEHRKVQTHEQTIAEAGRLNLTVEQALALDPMALTLEEAKAHQLALRDVYNAAATHMDDVGERMMKGEAPPEAYSDAFAVTAMLAAKDEMLGGTGARLLESRKVMSEAGRAVFEPGAVAGLAETLGAAEVDPFVLKARVDALKTKGQKRGFAATVGHYAWTGYKNILDIMHWAFIQNLLSGPQTHAANVLGTGALGAYGIPERYIAGAINDVFFRNPEGVHRQEAWAKARGMVEGLATDSVRMMGEALRGDTPLGLGPNDMRHFDLRAKTFGLDPETPLGKAVEIAGMMQPSRLMGVEDAAAKGMHYRGAIKALSLREGLARGLRGDDLAVEVARLEARPSAKILAEAKHEALLWTLNEELGPIGKALGTAIANTPAKWIIPFFRTPTNSIKAVWQRAPVLNLLSIQNWQDISAGGARRDMALARIALGSAVGCAVAWGVLQGNCTGRGVIYDRDKTLVTGEGSSDKNLIRDEREDGLPQFAMRLPGGSEWYHYNRFDPFGTYVGAIATAIENMSQVPDPDEHWFNVVTAAGLAAGRAMLSKTWAEGARNFLDALAKPDRDAKKIAMGFARAIVPAGIRQATVSGVPGVVEPHPEIRELRDFSDAILSGLPDLSPGAAHFGIEYDLPSVLDVAPRLHPITGDPMVRPPGWGPDLLSPIYVTKRKNDPVLNEITGNEVSIPDIPRAIFGSSTEQEMQLKPPKASDKVKLAKDEYYRLQVLATKGGEAGEHGGVDLGKLASLPTLYDRLLTLISSDAYKTTMTPGPEGSRADAIKQVVNVYREAARLQIRREYPALDRAIRDREELRLRLKVAPDRQPGPLPSTGPKSLDYLIGTTGR